MVPNLNRIVVLIAPLTLAQRKSKLT